MYQQWKALVSGAMFAISASMLAPLHKLHAAQIRRGANDEIVLEGKIERGDCQKMLTALREQSRRIYLASPGGNLFEAMEIGRLIRMLKMETVIPGRLADGLQRKRAAYHNLQRYPQDYTCASACFFAFVGGISRMSDLGRPILGIHRPFLSEMDLQKLSPDEAMSDGYTTRKIVDSYLKEMSVPQSYSERMFSVSPDQVEWISEDEFQKDFEGVIPELRGWMTAKANSEIEKNSQTLSKNTLSEAQRAFFDSDNQRLSDPVQRDIEILNGISSEAWIRVYGAWDSSELQRKLCRNANN
jgi:hypothetical protein